MRWPTNVKVFNSSFTDFPLIKLPPENDFFFKEDLWGSPWANTGYSYANAHIAQIKNAREHCIHVTDHSTMHVMK